MKISCTPEHPFWVDRKGWVAAKELKPGSRLLTKGGKLVGVESIVHREGSFTVYNIEVENLHSYYVSEIGVLVHNQCAAENLKGPIADMLPRNLTEQLTLQEARAGAGEVIIRNLGDAPRLEANYGAGEWVKMQHVHRGFDKLGNRVNTTIHWFRNLTSGREAEFKIVP